MRSGPRRSRRLLLGLLLLITVALITAGIWAATATPSGPLVSVSVSRTEAGETMSAGFVGLSIEYSAIHRYLGRDAHDINPLFTQLVAALAPGAGPVLRIGGDSSDHTWWPVPGVVAPAGVSYALTPDWLATVHAAAGALDAHLILGVNLAADRPDLAGAEARALIGGIGPGHVEALEVGNEPDVYTDFAWYRTRSGHVAFARGPSWDEASFQAEFSQWADALPQVPLAGPADAYAGWMSDESSFIASEPRLGLVTFHRYPLRGCGPESRGALAPTVAHLLSPAASRGLAAGVASFVARAHAAGLPFRVDELNSASCGGARGLSNTFASSLWVLDSLFAFAAVNVDGVNIHTLPGAAYAPFSFTESGGRWRATVNPLYDGLALFVQAFPPGARRLVTHVKAPASVRVWATRAGDGTVRTLVINDGSTPARVHLAIAGRRDVPVRIETLTAPSLTATQGIRLGGESYTPDSSSVTLGPAHTTTGSSAKITVAGDSASLITA